MHVKFAERIAANLAKVQASQSRPVAIQWWAERFSKITTEEFKQVQEAMNKLASKR